MIGDESLVIDLRRRPPLLFREARPRPIEIREPFVRLRASRIVTEGLRIEVNGLGEDEAALALGLVSEVLEAPSWAFLLDRLLPLDGLQ